jgi:hypothetical protein
MLDLAIDLVSHRGTSDTTTSGHFDKNDTGKQEMTAPTVSSCLVWSALGKATSKKQEPALQNPLKTAPVRYGWPFPGFRTRGDVELAGPLDPLKSVLGMPP